ncbi:3-hydroxyacyl-CoA dehydrogenase, partial [Rathayibacter sp. AY1D2]
MLDGFENLVDLAEGEVVTHSYVRDVPLPSGRTLALITLDNDRDHTRPNTFGPASLFELADVLLAQKERASRGEDERFAGDADRLDLAARGALLLRQEDVRQLE